MEIKSLTYPPYIPPSLAGKGGQEPKFGLFKRQSRLNRPNFGKSPSPETGEGRGGVDGNNSTL
jgi:hypothetical protein